MGDEPYIGGLPDYFGAHFRGDGRLGLGTKEMQGRMQINHRSNPSSPSMQILDSANGSGSTIEFARLGLDSLFTIKAFGGDQSAPSSLRFGVRKRSGSIIMLDQDLSTFMANGNVGFGTSSPSAKLQVNHRSSKNIPTLAILDSAGGAGSSIQFRRQGLDSAFSITGVPDGNESRRGLILGWRDDSLLWLKPNGALGLGTNMPMARMQVNHRSNPGNPSLLLLDSAGGIGNMLSLRKEGVNRGFNIGAAISEAGANSLSFLRFDASGTNAFMHYNANTNRLGINTINPQNTLDVNGSLRINGALETGAGTGQAGEVLTSQGPNLPPIWQNLNNKNPELERYFAFKTTAESIPSGSTGAIISLGASEKFDIGSAFSPATGFASIPADSTGNFNARVTINAGTMDNQPYLAKLSLEIVGADDVTVVSTADESIFIPAGVPNGTPITLSVSSLQKLAAGQKVRLRFTHTRPTSVTVRLDEYSGFIL